MRGVDATWTLPELVAEVAARTAALPPPKNGQVRAVPDERTVRYYATLGLLDRPGATRGRTALYGPRHAAQVVAIKRLQAMGRSLSEIQALWPTLDDRELARMSGVSLPAALTAPAARAQFWSREPLPTGPAGPLGPAGRGVTRAAPAGEPPPADPEATPGSPGEAIPDRSSPGVTRARVVAAGPPATSLVELRVELAPRVVLAVSAVDERMTVSPADVRAIRAAAAPLLAELASRRLAAGTDPDPDLGGEQ